MGRRRSIHQWVYRFNVAFCANTQCDRCVYDGDSWGLLGDFYLIGQTGTIAHTSHRSRL
ncbi:photosystem II protein PsbR [Vibrio vulnificus]|uniref:photosystem II protein PsbR n=1 Tax=Vibrio vulnificus TaxID=672 RepID=UPI001CCD9C20